MRGRVFFLFLLLAVPTMGWSQSTLNFPKFFSAAELPVTGFAVVNPGPNPATVYGNSPEAVAWQVEAISEAANCGDVDWFGATCDAPVFADGTSSGSTTCGGKGHRQSTETLVAAIDAALADVE